MAFVCMSLRTKPDYIAVLNKILEILPHNCLQRIVMDYEKGAWQAVKEVFPEIEIKGCLFHYCQVLNDILLIITIHILMNITILTYNTLITTI